MVVDIMAGLEGIKNKNQLISIQIPSGYYFSDDPADFTEVNGSNLYFGISDGGNNIYNNGNYLNTNITQSYADITSGNFLPTSSIPLTHTPYLGQDYGNYLNPPMDGIVKTGDPYFGNLSQYFTMMLPNLFVLAATNIKIEEFSIFGLTGNFGIGNVISDSFEFVVNNKKYTGILKTISNETNPSINQIFIVPGESPGLTHLYSNNPGRDHNCIQGLTGRDELFVLVTSKIPSLPLSTMDALLLSMQFMVYMDSPSAYQTYNYSLTPVFRPTEGGEGCLDTSVVNGKSLQRTGYYQITDPVNQTVKIVAVKDGESFNSSLETVVNVL